MVHRKEVNWVNSKVSQSPPGMEEGWEDRLLKVVRTGDETKEIVIKDRKKNGNPLPKVQPGCSQIMFLVICSSHKGMERRTLLESIARFGGIHWY